MRRFNLSKPATAADAGEETVREPSAAPPSRRRFFLVLLLLLVVAAFGANHLIGRFFWKGTGPPERVVSSPTDQTVRLSPAPPSPAPVVIPERSKTPPGAEEAPRGGADVVTPPLDEEREPSPSQTLQTGAIGKPRTARITEPGRFSVQVGAMAREANARALRQRLERLGYPSMIQKEEGSVTQHVVLVATPGDKTEADAVAERLRMEGVSASSAESDGGYRVMAGRSTVLDEAIDLARELQKKGFTTKIASETANSTLYLVRVGEFMRRSEARRTARELRGKGFPVFIVKR